VARSLSAVSLFTGNEAEFGVQTRCLKERQDLANGLHCNRLLLGRTAEDGKGSQGFPVNSLSLEKRSGVPGEILHLLSPALSGQEAGKLKRHQSSVIADGPSGEFGPNPPQIL
jgi:hypothetical protein